ncbi:Gfo/Idh/MocA family oxidoreductase [Rubellicoccus peritrichatus]|uniref:Gfo/Idh/MocA family oxidoreductase n=1 Tax=Rubellicoccus peritrichatus TaxID=3080537 RepID=A0AAQ3QW19_9BACT|nr:Gfo/Idh/MocA family oxidoreductase [Puniceicoccus sp. CR14]WOO41475.1 Gfo/Idh/MocA family oxidoreductase [Puniceicoccus sp. CR14]
MKTNRRTFLKYSGIAMASFPAIIPSRVFGANAPSKKITLGFIGMGGQGIQLNLKMFLNEPDCQVLTVCDAYMDRAHKAQQIVKEFYGNNDCKAVQDFREILDDPSIDAVVISTPDHWHVPMSIMAMEAGKDVFCEKPTLNIQQGRMFADAFAASDCVFQTGLEDRSLIHFHKMVEWVKNGEIGTLEQVNVQMPAGVDFPLEDAMEPPADLDWNLWQGPAAFHPFTKHRTGSYNWRNNSLYSKGVILDMGAHLVDTAQMAVNDSNVCPIEAFGTGDIPVGRATDVPITYNLNYRYSNGAEVNVKDSGKGYWDPKGCHIEFIGDKGWIRQKGWGGAIKASDKSILRTRYKPEESKHFPLPPREQRNFLDCVRSRKRTTYPAIDMHDISTTLHMGVISIELGRKLKWDSKKEMFINDTEANQLAKNPTPRDWESA